jgi:hypothetical protein
MIVTTGGRGWRVSSASTSARAVDVDVGFADAVDAVTELVDEQLGGVLVDGLGERDGRAHLEQGLDQICAALGHALGELLDGDRFGTTTSRTCFCAGPASWWCAFPSRGRGAARRASGRGCRPRRRARG